MGETDSLYERIRTHRKRLIDGEIMVIFALSAANKSAARRLETKILRLLMSKEYVLENSGSDHQHVNFGQYNTTSL